MSTVCEELSPAANGFRQFLLTGENNQVAIALTRPDPDEIKLTSLHHVTNVTVKVSREEYEMLACVAHALGW